MKTIYLDNNATTAVAPEVRDAMLPYLGELYGNPSSRWNHSWIHFHGSEISPLLASAGLEEEFCLEWHDFRLFESYLALVYREITGEFPPDARLLPMG